jgi:hypothetical protein
MQKIKRASCPFVNLPEKGPGRWRQGITPAVMRRCHWGEPVLVAQISLPGGPATTSFGNRSSWDCEPIGRQGMSYVNNE